MMPQSGVLIGSFRYEPAQILSHDEKPVFQLVG